MADQKIQKLARNLSQVKQISSGVNINTYYKEIKPFLFGNSNPQPIKDLSSVVGGIYNIVKFGKMTSEQQVIIQVAGKSSKSYQTANVTNTGFISALQKDESGNRDKNPAEYFFPSDLVRILTGLAKVFYDSGYNVDGLTPFASGSSDHQDFVKKWGKVNSEPKLLEIDLGYFYEENFESLNSSNVEKLLDAVANAAILFENIKEKPNLTQFDLLSNIKNKIIKEVVPLIFNEFIKTRPEYLKKQDQDRYEELIKPILDNKKDFIKEKSSGFKEKLSQEIKTLIDNNSLNFFRDLFDSPANMKVFESNHSYDPETKYFLFTTREANGEIIRQIGIKESGEIYSKFIDQSIKDFLDKSEVEKFTDDYILPLFKKADQTAATAEGDETNEEGGDVDEVPEEEIKLENPISLEEFKIKFAEEIYESIADNFLTNYIPQAIKDDEEFKSLGFIDFSLFEGIIKNEHFGLVKDAINLQINDLLLSDFNIDSSQKDNLTEKKLFLENNFDKKIFESNWYQDLLVSSFEKITTSSSPEPEYSQFFEYLYEHFIAPPISGLIKEKYDPDPKDPKKGDQYKKDKDEVVQESRETQDSSGATVPINVPGLPEINVIIENQIGDLSPKELRELQYKYARMYAQINERAIYELFTSKGIKREDIPKESLLKLQSKFVKYANSLNNKDFNNLFEGSFSQQNILLDFYQKSGYNINKFQNAQELLGETLQRTFQDENFNLDSPIITENIKNTVDGLIIQYGLNQDFYAFNPETQEVTQYSGTNKHDIVWFIENVPADRLALIFNLPSGLLQSNPEIAQLLKEALKSYAKYRASELSLHVQSNSLQNGLTQISDEDAQKIKDGDEATITKHLSFTKELRNISQKHGAETLAGALDEKKNSNKLKIQKQYKTFIPLWNMLSGEEQAIIYERNGLSFDKNIDLKITKLKFIPEFIYFDVTEFDEIRNIVDRYSKAKQRTLLESEKKSIIEIALIQDQLVREQTLSVFLNQSHERASSTKENTEIVEYYDGSDQDNISFRQRVAFDQRQGTQKKQNVLSRGLNKLLNRKKDPLKKAKKALKKAALNKIADKATAAALNLIPGSGTALSLALLAIKNKHIRRAIAGLLTGGLLLVARAFGSVGGMVGGLIGGAIGGAATLFGGGVMVVPGAITGALIGNQIIPQRLSDFWNNTNQTSPTPYQQPFTPPEATPRPVKPRSLGKLLSTVEGTAIMAVGGFSTMIVFMTLFIVLIIQSAFLIPVPQDIGRGGGSNGGSGLPDGMIACWPTTGQITQLPNIFHEASYKIDGISQAIDIAYDQSIDFPPPVYASHNGSIKIDDKGSGKYGIFIHISSPEGYQSIYAHLSQIEPSLKPGDSVKRGQLIGYMGNTGNSSGPHLHYEFSPGNLKDILPNGNNLKINDYIKEDCSSGGNIKNSGYIAIGTARNNNVVASSIEEINFGSGLTCDWRENKSLEVAINANFFNNGEGETGLPVGLAGNNNNVKYWEDARSNSVNDILRSLVVINGVPSMIDLSSDIYNLDDLNLAVTGIWASFSNTTSIKRANRTIIGIGIPQSKCVGETISGIRNNEKAIFLGVISNATYNEAEAMLRSCGATEFTHLDGGGSTAFCSDTFNFNTTRNVPVNIGFKEANIIKF